MTTKPGSQKHDFAVAAHVSAGHPVKTAALGENGVVLMDFWRAAAANMVLFGHAALIFHVRLHVSLGSMGVSIFFILSGFLITQSTLARVARPGPYFAPFMADRFARIFTAYVPALFFVALINAIFPLGRWGQAGSSTGPTVFLGNLLLLQDHPLFQIAHRLLETDDYIRAYNTAEPFWTIPIEFWIYAVFGLGMFTLTMRERLPFVVSAPLATIAVPVVVWNAAAGGGNGLTLAWLAGAMAAFLWVRTWQASRNRGRIGAAVALVSGVALTGRILKTGGNFQDIGVVVLETASLLAVLAIVETLPVISSRLRRAITFLASYSYSLYLVHNTILIIARQSWEGLPAWVILPLAIPACHVGAYLMYLGFERHYRQVGKWLKAGLQIVAREQTPAVPLGRTIGHEGS